MYRKPHQFPTPYYNHPSKQESVYYHYPPNSQYYNTPPYQQLTYNDQPPYPTPFEQFKKPDQPVNWPSVTQTNSDYYLQTNPNSPTHFMHYFYDENGQVDIGKMLSTVGQLANTVQQVSPVIKQFSSLIKTFK